jgi:hypothetical protein
VGGPWILLYLTIIDNYNYLGLYDDVPAASLLLYSGWFLDTAVLNLTIIDNYNYLGLYDDVPAVSLLLYSGWSLDTAVLILPVKGPAPQH